MPPVTTKTLGPLHHEDLAPNRFEDLVRQLIYDFRPWRMLEATGRAGSDDGFDARGFEMVGPQPALDVEGDGESADNEPSTPDRLWLVQCKREKAIGPTKLVGYLDAIPATERAQLHGIIFAASCDFSKKARDDFREKAREIGVEEAHLWGKAEIEDQLFQPKNDHLLFAYFGISLVARRRALKTDLRARLAMKRKAKKYLESDRAVLVRDASDDRYPWLDENDGLPRTERGRWRVVRVESVNHDGLRLLHRRHFAFLDDNEEHWDCAEWANDAEQADEDPWSDRDDHHRKRSAAMALWNALPEQNRAWFEVHVVLPFESILEIDPQGDDEFEGPHVYTLPFENGRPPVRTYFYSKVEGIGHSARWAAADDANRVEKFPCTEPAPSADSAKAVPFGDNEIVELDL